MKLKPEISRQINDKIQNTGTPVSQAVFLQAVDEEGSNALVYKYLKEQSDIWGIQFLEYG